MLQPPPHCSPAALSRNREPSRIKPVWMLIPEPEIMLHPVDGAGSYIHQVDTVSITPAVGVKRNGITLRRPCGKFVPTKFVSRL